VRLRAALPVTNSLVSSGQLSGLVPV